MAGKSSLDWAFGGAGCHPSIRQDYEPGLKNGRPSPLVSAGQNQVGGAQQNYQQNQQNQQHYQQPQSQQYQLPQQQLQQSDQQHQQNFQQHQQHQHHHTHHQQHQQQQKQQAQNDYYNHQQQNPVNEQLNQQPLRSHAHGSGLSQNVGNIIGNKSSIRQSKTFRMYESGNAVKGILGMDNLKWDVNRKEGAYSGAVVDHGATLGKGDHGRMYTGGDVGANTSGSAGIHTGSTSGRQAQQAPMQVQQKVPVQQAPMVDGSMFDHANGPASNTGRKQMQSTRNNYW
jgi:hypothetical protein